MEPEKKIIRWKKYFVDLLNGTIPTNPIENICTQQIEPLVNEVTKEEVKEAIINLNNWKAPESDNIPLELLKYGGEDMYNYIFNICHKVWLEEIMPDSWNEAVIIPLHKKCDKTECSNYRGISLLNSIYKVFSKVLLNRLIT